MNEAGAMATSAFCSMRVSLWVTSTSMAEVALTVMEGAAVHRAGLGFEKRETMRKGKSTSFRV